MRTYAERIGQITDFHLELFQCVLGQMLALPELDDPGEVSCHAVCQAFLWTYGGPDGRYPGLGWYNGWFGGKGNEHAWLQIGTVLIDPYPIGGCAPFMVDLEPLSLNPWSRLYVAHSIDWMHRDAKRKAQLDAVSVWLRDHMQEWKARNG